MTSVVCVACATAAPPPDTVTELLTSLFARMLALKTSRGSLSGGSVPIVPSVPENVQVRVDPPISQPLNDPVPSRGQYHSPGSAGCSVSTSSNTWERYPIVTPGGSVSVSVIVPPFVGALPRLLTTNV